MTTDTATTTGTDIAVVRAGFEALAQGDVAGVRRHVPRRRDLEPPQRRPPRRHPSRQRRDHGVHRRVGAAHGRHAPRRAESPYMADGEGRVAVPTRVSATRPDGRTFDDAQMLLFVVDGDRVRSVDQFVGDPSAVAAFWA